MAGKAKVKPTWSVDPLPAQAATTYINSVDIDVASSQIDAYLAALKENGAASVHEPGCRTFG